MCSSLVGVKDDMEWLRLDTCCSLCVSLAAARSER